MANGNSIDLDDRWITVIGNMAKEGKTNDQIAETLGISVRTLYRYKACNPDLSQALKEGASHVDAMVEHSLLTRALGYVAKDTKFATFNGVITDSKEYMKHYPPDTVACIYWLKNRKSEQWKDRIEEFEGEIPDTPTPRSLTKV